MDKVKPAGYSALQIGLHWTVATLVVLQFLLHEGMEQAFRDGMRGQPVAEGDLRLAYLHVATGASIFLLALWRVYLRLTRGAPPLPKEEPKPFRILAHATHFLIYALIIGMPISGSVAWFLGIAAAGAAHSLASAVLFWLVVLHVAGAFTNQFVFKTNVLNRMLEARD